MKPYIVLAVLAALAPHAVAQQQAARPHPADPSAAVPAATYDAAFTGYRSFRDEPLAPWRAVNEEVARSGGHAGIVGSASGPAGHGAAKPAVGAPASTGPAKTPGSDREGRQQ